MQFLDCKITLSFSNQKINDRSETLINKGIYEIELKFIASLIIIKDIAAWCGIKFDGSYSNPLYYAKHIYSDEDTEITNLVIPNSVTSIGWSAFFGCRGLTSITIPNSVTTIGEYNQEIKGKTNVEIIPVSA